MKRITVEYCGIEASGTTVREAKQAAAAQLSRLVKDVEQAPTIVRSGAYAKLVWRGIEGWRSTIIAAPDMTHGTMAHLYGSCMSGDDRTTAVRRALCDVVQLAWILDVGSNSGFATENGLRGDDLASFLRWSTWQRSYAKAFADLVANGLSEDTARNHAHHMASGLQIAA